MSFSAQHIRDARHHLRKRDPVMKLIINRVGPFTARVKRDRFGNLAKAIVSQQISGKAAQSIWHRLEGAVAPANVSPEALLKLGVPRLRQVGLSRQKSIYLLDLATQVDDQRVQLNRLGRCSDQKVIDELVQVKGIGVWTAQMFLIFSLGRLDVLPVGDLGIMNAIQKQYELADAPSPATMTKIAEPWRPYASIASWYLWRSLEFD